MRTVPMIALKGFSRHGGGGVHRRGDVADVPYRFAGEYLAKGLVSEDFRAIPGVELAHCLEIAAKGCLTVKQLKSTDDDLPKSCGKAIRAWQGGETVADQVAAPDPVDDSVGDDLTTIDGVGAPTAARLTEKGYGTFAALIAATDDEITGTGIANTSFGAVRVWRKAQAVDHG